MDDSIVVLLVVLQVMLQVDAEQNQTDDNDCDVEFVPEVDEYFHVFTELDAYPGQEVAPDQRTNECRADEHPEVCLEHAGWKRDECSHYRQHPANEESDVAVFVDPLIG